MAPVVVLGAGAAGAAMLARLLGDLLDGSWFSLRVVGETAAWVGYGMFAACFLVLDWIRVRRLERGLWPSHGAMWRTTIVTSLVALIGAVGLALIGATVLVALGAQHSAATDPVFFAALIGTGGVILAGLPLDVVARLRTRIGPRPS